MNQQINSRHRRIFSEAIKRKIVSDIETKRVSVLRAAREYDVSVQAVYGWLKKYSRHLKQTKTIVVQMESESYKTKELEKKIKELEAALGRKQLEIDFLNKMIELSKDELGIDLKKKFSTLPFSGSDSTKKNTGTG
jgi:transposase-like protein